jgi:hypothetical protein
VTTEHLPSWPASRPGEEASRLNPGFSEPRVFPDLQSSLPAWSRLQTPFYGVEADLSSRSYGTFIP